MTERRSLIAAILGCLMLTGCNGPGVPATLSAHRKGSALEFQVSFTSVVSPPSVSRCELLFYQSKDDRIEYRDSKILALTSSTSGSRVFTGDYPLRRLQDPNLLLVVNATSQSIFTAMGGSEYRDGFPEIYRLSGNTRKAEVMPLQKEITCDKNDRDAILKDLNAVMKR